MIAYLKGEVADLTSDYVVIDVNGVGYLAFVSARDVQAMPGIGSCVTLYTFLNVYQDGMALYGFLSRDDLDVFKLLITVSGVGPKAGLSVLSALSANDLRFAVFSDDSKTISKAPGIGPKTAKKIILDLKDKLKLEEILEENSIEAESSASPAATAAQSDAVAALTALGYAASDSLKAVRAAAKEDMDTEQILKAALRLLM